MPQTEGGQAFCPANCGEGQQTCAGPTDPKNGNQIGPDLCIPEKAGNCMMHCPVSCPEGMTVCPGPMGPDNCPTPSLCFPMETGCPAATKRMDCGLPPTCEAPGIMCAAPISPNVAPAACPPLPWCQMPQTEGGLAFCPANCGEGQQTCAGPTDPKNGNQIGPDVCIPEKAGNCMMHCPVSCPEGNMVCPGPMGPDNCPTPSLCFPMETGCPAATKRMDCPLPPTCEAPGIMCAAPVGPNDPPTVCPPLPWCQMPQTEGGQAFCPANCGEGQQTCAGPTDPKNGNQIGPDLCIPEKAGNCMMHCPVSCPEGMTVCPGPMGPDNCPTPALCFPMATGCPAA